MKVLLTLAAVASFAQAATSHPDRMQVSATKAVKLMEKSMDVLVPNVPCASCHHHMLPVWALSQMRTHGIAVDDARLKRAALKTYGFLTNVDRAVQGTQFVDPALEGAELLAFAKTANVPSSFTTAMHARRLATLQQEDGRWITFDSRPPQSFSLFMTTALSAKAVSEQMPETLSNERDARVAKAREWLLGNQPFSTEDMTFRLLGLVWTNAKRGDVEKAARQLESAQAADGGWPQVPGRESDAYATGEAMVALNMAGKASSARKRGAEFLMNTQLEDGSWLVKTRLHSKAPISPPYMETGFPHGKNQIISMYGTTLAALALSLEMPARETAPIDLAELKPQVEPWLETAAFGQIQAMRELDPALKTAGGSTPLMAAAHDPNRVAILIKLGADVTAKAKGGHTALSTAASYRGAAPVLKQLVAHGASAKPVKGTEFNENPLVYAAMANDVESARILLDNGANPTQVMLLQGIVPLSPVTAAVHVNSPAFLRELLARGVSPNHVEDIPLLSLAALSNRTEVARVLLAAGADPAMKDKYDWTAIQHAGAVEHDRPAVGAILQTPGASQ